MVTTYPVIVALPGSSQLRAMRPSWLTTAAAARPVTWAGAPGEAVTESDAIPVLWALTACTWKV